MADEPTPPTGRFGGRVALVTGASRGIGRAAAMALARQGAHVVGVARTVGALEELYDEIEAAGGQSTMMPFDLAHHELIDRLGLTLFERFGRLDQLVGNAAMLGVLGPVNQTDTGLWQSVVDLNLTANYRLIRSLDPLLRQSDAPRAVFVTAEPGRLPKAYWGAYAATKAGLETLVRIWAAETERTTPIRVNLWDPGPVRTALRAAAFPGEKPETVPAPEDAIGPLLDLLDATETRTGQLIA